MLTTSSQSHPMESWSRVELTFLCFICKINSCCMRSFLWRREKFFFFHNLPAPNMFVVQKTLLQLLSSHMNILQLCVECWRKGWVGEWDPWNNGLHYSCSIPGPGEWKMLSIFAYDCTFLLDSKSLHPRWRCTKSLDAKVKSPNRKQE